MTRKKESKSISHRVNLIPEIGKSLSLLHIFLVRLGGSGTRMKVYCNVRKGRHQIRSTSLTKGVKTR